VEIGKRELRGLLIETPSSNFPFPNPDEAKKASGDVIRLEFAARVKRFGGEMKLVLHSDNSSEMQGNRSTSLLKALARASQWREWILAGEVSGRRSIAQKLNLNERYVYRVLECAFRAPDIVEAILDGRQPSGLTYKKLTSPLPLSWVEQRKQLGFSTPRRGLNSQNYGVQ
jgi:site-specific DNA recombinase